MKQPSFFSVIESLRLPLKNFILSKIGSQIHSLKFVTSQIGPVIAAGPTPTDEFVLSKLIRRPLLTTGIGVLCCSGSSPAIREITLTMEISEDNPIYFEAPSVDDTYAKSPSKKYAWQRDYTKFTSAEQDNMRLPVLERGLVFFPFPTTLAPVFPKRIYEKHASAIDRAHARDSIFKVDERTEITDGFDNLVRDSIIQVGLLLDNEDFLLFEWNGAEQRFKDDFFNSGVATKSPKSA
jgi:hypothetical protein